MVCWSKLCCEILLLLNMDCLLCRRLWSELNTGHLVGVNRLSGDTSSGSSSDTSSGSSSDTSSDESESDNSSSGTTCSSDESSSG